MCFTLLKKGQNTIFNDLSHILRCNSFYRFLKYDRCKLIISFQFTDSILLLCAHRNQRRVRSNQSSLHVQGLVGGRWCHVARVEILSDSMTPGLPQPPRCLSRSGLHMLESAPSLGKYYRESLASALTRDFSIVVVFSHNELW